MTDNALPINSERSNMAALTRVLLFLFILATMLFNHSPIYHIAALLVIALAVLTVVQTGKIRLHSFFCYLALFLVYTVIQIWIIGVYDKAASMDMLQTMCINFVVYYSLFVILRQYETYKSALKIYTYAAVISMVLLLFVSLIQGELLQGRLMSDATTRFLGIEMSYNSNAIANYSFLSASIALLDTKKFRKSFRLFCLIIAIVTILLSGSRKALLIMAAVIMWDMLRKVNAKTLVFRVVAIVIFLVGVYFVVMEVPVFYDIIGSRLESLINFFRGGSGDSSVRSRNLYLELGWKVFLDHPLFGVGINNFMQYAETGGYTHNDYLELLSGSGLVGFLLCYLPKVAVLLKNMKQKRSDSLLFTLLILELFVVAIGTVSYYKREDWIIFIVALVACDRFSGQDEVTR